MSDGSQLYSLLQIGTSRAAGAKPAGLPEGLQSVVPVGGDAESQLWLSLRAWLLWMRAGLRPAEHPATVPDERLRLWETGSLDQRQAALAQWRAEDPNAARDALTQAWATEPPDARVQLLGCLGVGLGLGDEAFLEAPPTTAARRCGWRRRRCW